MEKGEINGAVKPKLQTSGRLQAIPEKGRCNEQMGSMIMFILFMIHFIYLGNKL